MSVYFLINQQHSLTSFQVPCIQLLDHIGQGGVGCLQRSFFLNDNKKEDNNNEDNDNEDNDNKDNDNKD